MANRANRGRHHGKAEDDPADTIRPRLDTAAQSLPLHILEGMRVTFGDNSTAERAFNLETGIATLEDALARVRGVRLIIVDPISAYLGGADSNTNAEVRGTSLRLRLSQRSTELQFCA